MEIRRKTALKENKTRQKFHYNIILKGFATFWEFSFRDIKKFDYEYHSLFAEKKIIFILMFFIFYVLKPRFFLQTWAGI